MLKQQEKLLNERMSARSFLARFEPEVLDLLLDEDKALLEDTQTAHLQALELGLPVDPTGTYPRAVWELIYRD